VWSEDDGVLEEPELWGVEQLGANGVMLRLVVKTTPSQQWRVSRALRERIKVAFDEEGIEIPFPQQTVWHKPAGVS
jgi:moderate conductance mechanosensitive channel